MYWSSLFILRWKYTHSLSHAPVIWRWASWWKLHAFEILSPTGTNWGNQHQRNAIRQQGGWEASMLKLDALRNICKYVDDYDWVLSVDSDVVFCNSQVFDWVNVVGSFRLNNYGILGIHQVGPLAKCHLGELHNMSGCSIYLRGGIAKRIANLTSEELVSVRAIPGLRTHRKMRDIVISYLAQTCGPIRYRYRILCIMETSRKIFRTKHWNLSITTTIYRLHSLENPQPESGTFQRVLRQKELICDCWFWRHRQSITQ